MYNNLIIAIIELLINYHEIHIGYIAQQQIK